MTTEPRVRHVWMDAARGLAVLLVAFMHASAAPSMMGVPYPEALQWIARTAEPYRMPMLLILSGALLTRSLKKGWLRYYSGKIQLIAWPFAVWFVIHWAVNRYSPWSIWDITFWLDGAYLWFLVVIGYCYLIGPVTRVVPPIVLCATMLVGSILVSHALTERFLYYGSFFFLGAQIGKRLSWFTRLPLTVRVIGIVIAVAWSIAVASIPILLDKRISYYLLSAVGVSAILLLLQKLRSGPVMRFLAWCGEHSIVFYVAHFPVTLIVAFWYIDRGIYNPWMVGGSCFTAAVVTSIALARARHIIPFAWLFKMPTPSRRDWYTIKHALRVDRTRDSEVLSEAGRTDETSLVGPK